MGRRALSFRVPLSFGAPCLMTSIDGRPLERRGGAGADLRGASRDGLAWYVPLPLALTFKHFHTLLPPISAPHALLLNNLGPACE